MPHSIILLIMQVGNSIHCSDESHDYATGKIGVIYHVCVQTLCYELCQLDLISVFSYCAVVQ